MIKNMQKSQILRMVESALDYGRAEFDNGSLFLENVSDEDGQYVFNMLKENHCIKFVKYPAINGFVVDFM